MRRLHIYAVLMLAGQPLVAQQQEMDCNYVTECYQAEACKASDFTVLYERNMQVDPVWSMSDINGDLTAHVAVVENSATTLVQAETPDAAHLMMIGADGIARYAVLIFEGPQIITYHGTCEGFE